MTSQTSEAPDFPDYSGAPNMKKLIPVAAVAAAIYALFATSPLFSGASPATSISAADFELLYRAAETARVFDRQSQMTNATVRIELEPKGSGSGTVLHSSSKGTYILTNFHVAGEKGSTVQARFWVVNRLGETTLAVLKTAEVVASDPNRDLALLRLADSEFRAEAVASIAPADYRLRPGEDVWVAGSALGLRAHLTQGLLSVVSHEVQGMPHIVTSSPVIMGNSGGSLYALSPDGRYLVIGTVRAIAMVGFGAPVTTVNYSVPNEALRAFLKDAGHEWVAG